MIVSSSHETELNVERIIDFILSKKGDDIVALDLRKISGISDFFIIVTGNSSVHVKAIADEVKDKMKDENGSSPWHIEGYAAKKWILLDYVDIVVHVFDAETRSYYMIEQLWKDADIRTIKTQD